MVTFNIAVIVREDLAYIENISYANITLAYAITCT